MIIIIRQAQGMMKKKKKKILLNLMAPRARTAIKENNDFTVMPISFISSFFFIFNWNSIKNRFQLIFSLSLSEDIPTTTTSERLTDWLLLTLYTLKILIFFYFRRKSIEIKSPHNFSSWVWLFFIFFHTFKYNAHFIKAKAKKTSTMPSPFLSLTHSLPIHI